MKKYKKEILIGFLIWNGIGLITGLLESAMERNGHYVNEAGSFKRVSDSNGCIYKSILAFTNLGHIIGCELLRARWEIGK